jgi:hypothetical protein
MVSSAQAFIEPPELRETLTSQVEIQVVSTLLSTQSGRETRQVKYHAGVGFTPEAFTIMPAHEGVHLITVRLFYERTILYRERIRVNVEDARRAANA